MEDALYEAGCSDGMIVRQAATISVDFVREAPSLRDAVMTAIRQVESALPDARVAGLDPCPYRTSSELSKSLGVSREYVRLLAAGLRGEGDFPAPAYASDRRMYWSLRSVLSWYSRTTGKVNSRRLEDAHDLASIFLALEIRRDAKVHSDALGLLKDLASQQRAAEPRRSYRAKRP